MQTRTVCSRPSGTAATAHASLLCSLGIGKRVPSLKEAEGPGPHPPNGPVGVETGPGGGGLGR